MQHLFRRSDRTTQLLATSTLLLAFLRCGIAKDPSADLVLLNGKFVTLDAKLPVAAALAIKGDRITVVGSDKQIERHIGDETKVIHLGGKLAIPGFIEGHGHFTEGVTSLVEV